jgi:hypothetical protein
MKNIVLEELNRVKLLMSYDSKNTLSENIEIIKLVESKKIISEQTGKALLKSILGTSDEAAALALKSTRNLKYTAGVTLFNDVKIYGKTGLSSGDEVMTALIKNTLNKAQLSELAKGLMKTGKATGSLRTTLTNKAADMAVKDVKYANMTQTQVSKSLVKKGYDPAIADEIAAKFANKKGLSKISPVKGGKTPPVKGGKTPPVKGGKTPPVKNRKPPVKPRVKKLKPIPGKPTMWQRFKTKIAGMTRGKIFKYLLAAGGLYLLWRWWMDEGSKPFPDCLSKNIPTEDLQKMGEEGLEYILITDTGNGAIDKNGGGKFFDDKKFVTGNDKYTGKWDETDSGIVITVNGTDYAMSCEGMVHEDDCPEGQTWDGEKCVTVNPNPNPTPWVDCTSLPYKKGCKNNDIKKIQDCLGIKSDGKFGSDTERALKSKGYDVVITQEIYDKIMANCGGTTTTTTLGPDRASEYTNEV